MKYPDNFEKLIEEALKTDQEEVLKSYDDMNIFQQSNAVFKGKTKWASIINYVYILIFWFATLFCLIQAVIKEDTIFWLLVMNAFLMMMAVSKLWHWMQINRNAVTNEIKMLRLEIRAQNNSNTHPNN